MSKLQTILSVFAVALLFAARVPAQSFRKAGTEFQAMRPVSLPADKAFSVVVVQFFHHGQIDADGRNALVFDQSSKAAPTRVLQVGPGDYCRLAFQATAKQNSYEIFYGGKPPAPSEVPPWTSDDGLLLETRQYQDCNLNRLESVQKAFEAARPIGANYVDAVRHSYNPCLLTPGPFLSRYSGTLRIAAGGSYGFFTSSQDCSFLLIDGKVVVDAPGRHGPIRQARPETRRITTLSAGTHRFEYYHAASGPEAMMAAAWEVDPKDAKPKPAPIPPEAFRCEAIGRALSGPVTMRDERLLPDFLVNIAGDIPLPDHDIPLVVVQFANTSPPALTTSSKALWDFGDGQTSEELNPTHVYLRPGLYAVKLTVKRGLKPFEMTNRIYVDRPRVTGGDRSKLPKLDDFLPVLQTYAPKKLDAVAVRQLVLAYQAKAQAIANPETEAQSHGEPPAEEPASAEIEQRRAQEAARKAEALRFLTAAVDAAKTALVDPESAATGDDALYQLARLAGPMARELVGDSLLAGQIVHGAAEKIVRSDWKAECELEAADIAINDLVQAEAGKRFLDAATPRLREMAGGPLASLLKRVWGDYYAATGDGEAARKSYQEAEAALSSQRSHLEQTAWQGAHARSTEAFLAGGELERAVAQIHAWQREFPGDKANGSLALFYARYWAARGKHDQAIALADQLLVVNPDSPYIDQLLIVAADSEVARGKLDRALATLQSILKDYPGSPLVPQVKAKLAKLQSGDIDSKKSPRRTPR